jgi:hypothetical protein
VSIRLHHKECGSSLPDNTLDFFRESFTMGDVIGVEKRVHLCALSDVIPNGFCEWLGIGLRVANEDLDAVMVWETRFSMRSIFDALLREELPTQVVRQTIYNVRRWITKSVGILWPDEIDLADIWHEAEGAV